MKGASVREGGFTLVEALVSLFIFALVASGAVLMLSQTLQAQKHIEGAQNELRALQAARALLISDLAQVTPRAVREEGRPPFVFVGLGGIKPTISFVRTIGERGSDDRLSTRLVVVDYHVDEDGRLVRMTRDSIDPGSLSKGRERALIDGARNVRFTFNDGGRWRSDWPASMTGVPRAVAVDMTLPRYGDIRMQALTGL